MRSLIIIIIFIIICAIFFVRIKDTHIPGYYEIIKDKKNIPIIKVQAIEDCISAEISTEGEFEIQNQDNKPIRQGKNGAKKMLLQYDPNSKGFIVVLPNLTDKLKLNYIKIQSQEGNPIQVNNRYFVGTVIFKVTKNETIEIINELDLETYLLGVLLGETSDDFQLEAIKAQAITSRTFALSEMASHQNQPWHVKSSVKAQVFSGMSSVPEKIKNAILQTRGEILNDRGKIFRSYFSSSCGGSTADLTSLPWETDNASVMQSRECPFCKKIKPSNFNWEIKYSKSQLLNLFINAGHKINSITSLEIGSQDSFGRVLSLNVFDQEQKLTINALRFRVEVLKDTFKFRSCLFTINTDGNNYIFRGTGWGHGVGLCQYGSQGMAKEGRNCYDILKFYYTGVQFSKYYQ